MTAYLHVRRRRRRRTFSCLHRRGLVTISALVSFLILLLSAFCQAQRSDPSQFNGGSILAMAGRNSVAIAIDSRFGLGMQTISTGDNGLLHDDDTDGILTNEDDHEKIMTNDQGRRGGSSSVGNPRILHLPNSNALLAWTGLYGDGIGFAEEMNVLLARKVRRAGMLGFGGSETKRKMSPRAITMLMSHMLYRRRNSPYYVEPVVVGLESVCVPIFEEHPSYASRELELQSSSVVQVDENALEDQTNILRPKITSYRTILKPYLCGTDMLGAQSSSQSFVCSGVASRSLHGTAEALWKPNLNDDELVEVCGKAFLSALERDILSGYGAVVYLIKGGADENDVQIIEYVLACRND